MFRCAIIFDSLDGGVNPKDSSIGFSTTQTFKNNLIRPNYFTRVRLVAIVAVVAGCEFFKIAYFCQHGSIVGTNGEKSKPVATPVILWYAFDKYSLLFICQNLL